MRREGYEFSVSRPEVLIKDIGGVPHEPEEFVILDINESHVGSVMESMGKRKATLKDMTQGEITARLEFVIPTRGLFGFRSEFLTLTKGTGIINRNFHDYIPHCGEIAQRTNGVLIAMENGKTTGFSLFNLQTSYEVLGDYNKQISTLRRILEVDGHNVKASSILVRALYKQKKFKEATDEYTRTKLNFEYFKGRSGFGPYHADLAKTALLIGDYKYFGHIYDDLLKQSPTAENYQVYGIVEYQKLGNKKKAKQLLLIALKIDSKIKIPANIRNDLGI